MKNKSRIIKNLYGFLFLLFISSAILAQNPKPKFGKPNIDDLKMQVYSKDTGASAVVLYEFGEFNLNDFNFYRHTIIKILKKDGYDWADGSFFVDDTYSLKGYTYNLENGQVVESKLEKESIFKESWGNNRYRIKFTMPNVREGSIIEFKYSYSSLPENWYFQYTIPVVYSELKIPESQYFSFNTVSYGFGNIKSLGSNHWYAQDVPAIKKEAYMTTIYNYVSKLEFEIRNVSIPGRFYKSYTESWDNVNNTLCDASNFGESMRASSYLSKMEKEIEEKNLPPYNRMKLAYQTLQKRMKWNEYNSAYSRQFMASAFKEQSGGTAEINLMLIALLKDLKLDANPIVLSTRDNGMLHPVYPTMNKLNYVVAHVKIDTTNYILDATDPLLPINMLPMRCLNGPGRYINTKEIKGNWYNLTPKAGSSKVTFLELKINNLGEVAGKLSSERKGYSAYDFREEVRDHTSIDKYVENYQVENKGLKLNTFKVENLDSLDKNVKFSGEVEIADNTVVTSDKIFFNPLFFEQLTENPFKTEKRTFPVDFGYPMDRVVISKIEIPEGYSVSELPKSGLYKSPDNTIKFTYALSATGNNIMLNCKFSIGKTTYMPEDYEIIRELFNQIVSKQAEQIVLKKNS